MVTHTRSLCSAFNPSQYTHTAVNTHPEQWAAIYAAAPGEQLGVWCLAQGSHLSRGIEGGESAGYSLPPPTIPAGVVPNSDLCQIITPLVLVGLGLGVGEGLGLGNHIAISTRGVIIWQGVENEHNTGPETRTRDLWVTSPTHH